MAQLKSIANHITMTLKTQDDQLWLRLDLPVLKTEKIKKLQIDFKETIPLAHINIFHAINHVITDLIQDASYENIATNQLTFEYEQPTSMSHIFFQIKPAASPSNLKDFFLTVDVLVTEVHHVENVDENFFEYGVDAESLAFKKAVHTQMNPFTNKHLTDGNLKTSWESDHYPCVIDIDLEAVACVSDIHIHVPPHQQVSYVLYGSLDDENYQLVADLKQIHATKTGILSHQTSDVTFRHLRVLWLYNSASTTVVINQIRVIGSIMSQEEKQIEAPGPTLLTDLALPVIIDPTATEIIESVYGIIDRRLGTFFRTWFLFEIDESCGEKDFYHIQQLKDRIHITGNNGVSLATGLNHYLKYHCHVNLSQSGVGDQVHLPKTPPVLKTPIFKVSNVPLRYAYNYCTHSYTMAFWDETDWQNELDWLALNGVNLVLDITGQEAVIYEFLRMQGYEKKDIYDYICLPTHSAWQLMGNMGGFGGPVNRAWLLKRANLGRKNQQKMHTLGMKVIRQGFIGLLPTNFITYHPEAQVISQGTWCEFDQPDVLNTTSDTFKRLAKDFYQAQEKIFGKITHYYAADPFHEGGTSGQLLREDVYQQVLNQLLAYDEQAIWVIQSWQENPKADAFKKIQHLKKHLLVLDLYADTGGNWHKTDVNAHGGKEFGETPWIFCMLNNFGGRMGLVGHIDIMLKGFAQAINDATCLTGIGVTPEATLTNPLLFDLFFEISWFTQEEINHFDLDTWLYHYSWRRYGDQSTAAWSSLKILTETVYAAKYHTMGQGAPESVINGRPNLPMKKVSTWGNTHIEAPTEEIVQALHLLMEDYDTLKISPGYMFDVIVLCQQVLSNQSLELTQLMHLHEKNPPLFNKHYQTFQAVITLVDQISHHVSIYQLSDWLNKAKALGAQQDDYLSEMLMLFGNIQITTWGAAKHANQGLLADYSNRQWSGLTGNLYKKRWEKWHQRRLVGKETMTPQDWFEFDWHWILNGNKKTTDQEDFLRLYDKMMNMLDKRSPVK